MENKHIIYHKSDCSKQVIFVVLVLVFLFFPFLFFGQEIKNVKIGEQVWSTENLNVDKFRNGDKIAYASNPRQWLEFAEKKEPAWCYWEFDSKNSKYGKFYNGFVVIDKRYIAPLGWKLPSVKDFEELLEYLNVNKVEGFNINRYKVASSKLRSPFEWIEENGTNSSGFSAFPFGSVSTEIENKNVKFINLGSEALYWSNEIFTKNETINALQLISNTQDFCCNGIIGNWYEDGSNIRLIRDNLFVDKGITKNVNLVNNYNQKNETIKKEESELNGCLKGNCENGYGVFKQDIGIYSGYFKNGFFTDGEFKYNSGDIYQGDWVKSTINGKGIFKFKNGNSYNGEWVNSSRQGYGTFEYNNGDRYDGDWVNDVQQGYGTYKYNNGDRYDGDWVSGVRQGKGKMTYSSGRIEEGTFINNYYISSKQDTLITQDNFSNKYNVDGTYKSTNNSSLENTNNNIQTSTNLWEGIQKDLEVITNSPLLTLIGGEPAKISKSGININGEKCKKCNIVLKTPQKRNCYICNRQFSGWGFIKKDYGITSEHIKLLSACYPYLGCHNYKDWSIHPEACCSRQCAMKL